MPQVNNFFLRANKVANKVRRGVQEEIFDLESVLPEVVPLRTGTTKPDPNEEPFKEFDYHVTYGHQKSHKYGVALSWFLHFFDERFGDLALTSEQGPMTTWAFMRTYTARGSD